MILDINKISINLNTSIIDTMKHIDMNGRGIVYVIDKDNKLIGTVTDGDIRRAIINGISLETTVDKIMNKNPIKAIINMDNDERKKLMIKKAIRELPLVNDKNELIDTISLNDFFIPKGKSNIVLIMAGGLGTRLKDLTKEVPKPMLNLADKPVLEHIIENFKLHGFNKFLLSVNYKQEIIESYFQDGLIHGCKINYIRESKRLGTAGAISLAKDYIEDDFFVSNGDVYSTVNFNDMMNFHKENENDITILGIRKKISIPYGVLEYDKEKNILNINEKPNIDYIISGGIYCLNPKVIKFIPENTYFEITELIDICIHNKMKVKYYNNNDYWIDIGKMEDYNKAQSDIYDLVCCTKEGDNYDKR